MGSASCAQETELFAKRDKTDPRIYERLSLWGCHGSGVGVILKSARETRECLDAASIEDDPSQVTSRPCTLYDEFTWPLKVRTGSN